MPSLSSPIINEHDPNLENYKLRGNVVFRQELKSLTPKCDAAFAIVVYILLITIFLTFGIPILLYSSDVVQYRKGYSNVNGW